MDARDQVPRRSIPKSDEPPIRRRLKPWEERVESTVYS
jgi:tetrahydromethanopterin S-methyltransferase subunit G